MYKDYDYFKNIYMLWDHHIVPSALSYIEDHQDPYYCFLLAPDIIITCKINQTYFFFYWIHTRGVEVHSGFEQKYVGTNV